MLVYQRVNCHGRFTTPCSSQEKCTEAFRRARDPSLAPDSPGFKVFSRSQGFVEALSWLRHTSVAGDGYFFSKWLNRLAQATTIYYTHHNTTVYTLSNKQNYIKILKICLYLYNIYIYYITLKNVKSYPAKKQNGTFSVYIGLGEKREKEVM